MTKEEIFEKVKCIIAEKLSVDEDSITMDLSFVDDLKTDSMDILDLVSGFEDEFNISISDDQGKTFETVREVVDFLAQTVN